jgi:hypothetical protein
MSVFDETSEPKGTGVKWLVMLVLLLAVGAGLYYVSRREPPASATTAPEPARPRPPSTPAPVARAPRDTTPAADTAPATPRADSEPAPPVATPRPGGVLRVRSDVPGASVFLDRKFLGNTPLEVDGVEPGSHRLNVSIEGYEGHAQAIDIGDAPAHVEVRFKDVRLDTSVPVIHKHAMGSCVGRLLADTSGLRYETANASDAFTMPFAEVEAFTVDYLKKSLRVKRRGGKAWTFEDPNGQPDPLFVFHRDVEKARARLTAR